MENLKNKVKSIATKHASLVEKRIDGTKELTGNNLEEIYSSIQMLGHIVMTLERISRIENGAGYAADPYPGTED